MATPTITNNFTTFNDASTDPGTGWGQNSGKWDTDIEIYIEGSSSLGCSPNATGDGGNGWTGTSFNASTNLVLVWIYVVDASFVTVFSSYGVYIRLGSGGAWTDDYNDYRVGGSDVDWVGRGWGLIVLDANRTPDRTGASSATLTGITRVGVGVNAAKTSSKSTAFAIDAIRYGTTFELTGSTSTTGVNLAFTASTKTITRASGDFGSEGYVSGDRICVRGSTNNDGLYTANTVGTTTMTVLEALTDESSASGRTIDQCVSVPDIYVWDNAVTTRKYGIITRNKLGIYEVNFPITIGDASGSNRTAFLTEGRVLYFSDQPTALTGLSLKTVEDSSAVTRFFAGQSVNTLDNRVGFGGSVFSQNSPQFGAEALLDLSEEITEIGFFGSTCLGLDAGVRFPNASGDFYCTSSTFNACGQVDLGQAESRRLNFVGYTQDSGAALLWNEDIDIKYSNFFANNMAIEHSGSAGSPYAYENLIFGANNYDVNNTADSGILINNNDSNALTYTGTYVDFQTTVTIRVTVKDVNGDPVENVQTGVYATETVGDVSAGDELITGSGGDDTDANGRVQNASFNYQGTLNVEIRARRSSSGQSPRYKPLTAPGQIVSTGMDVIVTILEDTIVGP